MTTYFLSCAWCPQSWSGPDQAALRGPWRQHMLEQHPERVRPNRPTINARDKVAVAERLGVPMDDQQHPIRCAYCSFLGTVRWSPSKGMGYVMPLALEWEHVVPLALGGSNTAENLVLACRPCNRAKKNRTPEQWLGLDEETT